MELLSRMQRWEGVIGRLWTILVLNIGLFVAIALENLVHEMRTMSKILSWVFLFSTTLVAPILLTRARTSFLINKLKESFSRMTTAKQVSTAFEDVESELYFDDSGIRVLYIMILLVLAECHGSQSIDFNGVKAFVLLLFCGSCLCPAIREVAQDRDEGHERTVDVDSAPVGDPAQ